ncbi:MAG TPA: glycosyltransferase family 2 protein, partial [Burkholderiales bacterium]|nr:glycosyltransferase family 2 protein [Burkholderiales bacterium]
MRDPLVSIVMPAFDAKAWAIEAAASLLEQTYQNWELVVVSDDREDYGCILPCDERIRHYRGRRYASGPAAARNVGLLRARGELVAHLDADDLFHPERLERLVPLAMEHGAALDNMRIIDFEKGSLIAFLFDVSRNSLSFDDALDLNYPFFPVYRKSLISPWDEDIVFSEDVLFNLRIISKLSHVPVVNIPLMDYRVRSGSLSCSSGSCERAEEAYCAILGKLDASGMGFS